MPKSAVITKSKYLIGLQCPRYQWIRYNDPGAMPEADAVTQYRFEQGDIIEGLARKRFPSGIDIPYERFKENIARTRKFLKQRKPLFEAGILRGNTYSRVDILRPVGAEEWDIIEVKSTTEVKDVHLDDVSFQRYCCEKAGLKIRKCFLMYINNRYVRRGDIDPDELFTIMDITAEVAERMRGIQARIDAMSENIRLRECPPVDIGPYCNYPFECPLVSRCWESLPENSVFDLYGLGQKAFELYKQGILAIKDIPDEYVLTGKQQVQRSCERNGKVHVDKIRIRSFLNTLEYPVYYLDVETISPTVPLFDGTRPYQCVPFQFSLHIQREKGARPEHAAFLAGGREDPRGPFIENLRRHVGEKGSVVVYNQSFESGVLRDLGAEFPEHETWVRDVQARMADLLFPFRSFAYYNPLQKGSASIKKVLPALTDRSYEGMDISGGQQASISFMKAAYGDASEKEREKIRKDLEKYCALDTEGMVLIVNELQKLVNE